MAQLTARFRDAGIEYSSVSFPIPDAVGATTWTDLLSYVTTLSAALGGLSIGTLISIAFRQLGEENSDAAAANPFAQRELGVRFFFTDDTNGDKSYVTIPCPDLTNIALESNGDTLDLTDTEAAAMVTWIEANVEINAGNSVSVDRAVVVGRKG